MKIMTTDPVSASKGLVFVVTDFSSDPIYGNPLHRQPQNRMETWHLCKVAQATPLKTGGLHLCTNDKKLLPIAALIISTLEITRAIKARIHIGSFIEVSHILMSYGIPPDAIPIKLNGDEDYPPKGYLNFLAYHKRKEGETSLTEIAYHISSDHSGGCTKQQQQEEDEEELQFRMRLDRFIHLSKSKR